jgi:flagellar basal body-associated protein FliL
MAEEKAKGKEEGDAPKEGAAASGSKKKLIIISAILVADLLLLTGVAFFIASRLKAPESKAAAHQEVDEEKQRREERTRIGHTLPKPWTYTVNIGAPGEEHYLKCAVQLEWEGPAHGEEGGGGGGGGHGGGGLDAFGSEIEKRKDKISDIIINILTSQPYAELMRPSGKQKLKEAIVSEVGAILPAQHGTLKNAFFTEFLLQ